MVSNKFIACQALLLKTSWAFFQETRLFDEIEICESDYQRSSSNDQDNFFLTHMFQYFTPENCCETTVS